MHDQIAQPQSNQDRKSDYEVLSKLSVGNRFRLMFGMSLLPEKMTYKYLICGLPRSMTYWCAVNFDFDHDQSADLTQMQTSPGLADTGIYLLPQEEIDKLIDDDTRIVVIRRPIHEIANSILAKIPEACPQKLEEWLQALEQKLVTFSQSYDCLVVDFPLRSSNIGQLCSRLNIDPSIVNLEERWDLMDDKLYLEKTKQLAPYLFKTNESSN